MIPAFAPLRYTCLTKSSFFHTIPGTGPRSQALGHHKRKDWHIALVRAFWPRRPGWLCPPRKLDLALTVIIIFSPSYNCEPASGRPEMTSLSPSFYRPNLSPTTEWIALPACGDAAITTALASKRHTYRRIAKGENKILLFFSLGGRSGDEGGLLFFFHLRSIYSILALRLRTVFLGHCFNLLEHT